MSDGKLLNKVFTLLKSQNLTVSTAESCTGGLIAHTLTNVSGSSKYFDSGVVSYSNAAKMRLLNVSEGTLEKYGAVSKETAEEMARGVRISSGTDVGISTTGIAGPTGETKEKPIGLVYISVSTKEKTIVKKFNFSGNRLENKESICNAALSLFIETLETK